MHFLGQIALWLQLHSVLAMIVVFSLLVITTYWPGRRADIERDGGERPDFPVQEDGTIRAHAIERDGAGRDRRGVAVLQP